MPATKVFIARHGERIDHVNRAWRSTADNPADPYLTPRGLEQASALAKHLTQMQITHIFSSPFYRTLQTANEVSRLTKVPIKIEHGLKEYLNPEWYPTAPVLKSVKELKQEFEIDESHESFVVPVYPERRDVLIERTSRCAKLLAARYDGNILLVGHGITCEFSARGITQTGPRPYITYCALQTCVREDEAGEEYRLDGPEDPEIAFMPEDIRPYVKRGYQ